MSRPESEPSSDPLYVAARRVLLDAMDALSEHRSAVVLAGAQAIYVRTGQADLDVGVAPFTTDADLTIDPRMLGPDPDEAAAADHSDVTIVSLEPDIDGRAMTIQVAGHAIGRPASANPQSGIIRHG